ncbi:MAG: hypothetical protein IKT46_05410 [Clostridia bacterium]|nr:hypothetical protein [Clostridia bacterium]
MSYCVNCGVELAEYIKKCPLCSTEVINPNQPYDFANTPPYPEYEPITKQRVSIKTMLGILAVIFAVPIAVCLVADLSDSMLTWSGYIISSLFTIYTIIVSALVIHRRSVLLEQIFDYGAISLLLIYIEYQSKGGWLLSFALPLLGGIALSTLFVTFLAKVLNKRILTVISFASFVLGALCVLCDFLIKFNFYNSISIGWSLYPLISLTAIGTVLIVIDSNSYLKRRLAKKFFI